MIVKFSVQEHGEWLGYNNLRFRQRQAWDGD